MNTLSLPRIDSLTPIAIFDTANGKRLESGIYGERERLYCHASAMNRDYGAQRYAVRFDDAPKKSLKELFFDSPQLALLIK